MDVCWKELRMSRYVERVVTFWIRDMPIVTLEEGEILGERPQSAAVEAFVEGDIEILYEKVDIREVKRFVGEGKLVSSAFNVWPGEEKSRKGSFVVNVHK